MPRNSRFRRRPNNTGTVVKLSGKRRNPFCARVMSDERDIITGKKKQICIGTFSTREEALNALSLYSLKRSNSITNEEARNLAPDLFDRKQIHIDEPCNDDGVERKISYIITGSKTEAGRNRIIPIHEGIKQYVIDELIVRKERLFDSKRTWFYMTVLYALNDQLGMNHKMHDTRDTFASLCQLYNVDIYIRKKVLGHKLNDITFDIYTNASKNKLWTEINKIKF